MKCSHNFLHRASLVLAWHQNNIHMSISRFCCRNLAQDLKLNLPVCSVQNAASAQLSRSTSHTPSWPHQTRSTKWQCADESQHHRHFSLPWKLHKPWIRVDSAKALECMWDSAGTVILLLMVASTYLPWIMANVMNQKEQIPSASASSCVRWSQWALHTCKHSHSQAMMLLGDHPGTHSGTSSGKSKKL